MALYDQGDRVRNRLATDAANEVRTADAAKARDGNTLAAGYFCCADIAGLSAVAGFLFFIHDVAYRKRSVCFVQTNFYGDGTESAKVVTHGV